MVKFIMLMIYISFVLLSFFPLSFIVFCDMPLLSLINFKL